MQTDALALQSEWSGAMSRRRDRSHGTVIGVVPLEAADLAGLRFAHVRFIEHRLIKVPPGSRPSRPMLTCGSERAT